MLALHAGYAFGRADEVEALDVPASGALENGRGRSQGTARGEHGIKEERPAVRNVLGQLDAVFHGLERFLVPGKADDRDLGAGHEADDAVHEADAGAQHRHDGELFARDLLELDRACPAHAFVGLGLEIARGFVGQQDANLAGHGAEDAAGRGGLAQYAQLVPDKGMIDDVHCHGKTP